MSPEEEKQLQDKIQDHANDDSNTEQKLLENSDPPDDTVKNLGQFLEKNLQSSKHTSFYTTTRQESKGYRDEYKDKEFWFWLILGISILILIIIVSAGN